MDDIVETYTIIHGFCCMEIRVYNELHEYKTCFPNALNTFLIQDKVMVNE